MALKSGAAKADPVLLEPIMKIEVIVPEEFVGEVIGGLSARRAQIQGMEPRAGNVEVVHALVPLATMFGYATDLRSTTQGRGTFTMEYDHYDRVPSEVAERVVGGAPMRT